MFTIGEFAARARVTVRMLRHYDAIGPLRPADVDPHRGYRRYELSQLDDLLRVTELRDLGCSLEEATAVLGARDHPAQHRAVLLRRQSELLATIDDDTARLARVRARLFSLERNAAMSETSATIETSTTIEYRRIPAVTVYAASGVAPGGEDVAGLVDRILPPLLGALHASGVAFHEPGVFWYENEPGTDDLRVWVSCLRAMTRRRIRRGRS